MHQKTYHCIYNEGLCNAYFPLSENNDECEKKENSETWSISLVNHLLCCWGKLLSGPKSLSHNSNFPDKSMT